MIHWICWVSKGWETSVPPQSWLLKVVEGDTGGVCTASEVTVSSRPDLGFCPVGRYLVLAGHIWCMWCPRRGQPYFFCGPRLRASKTMAQMVEANFLPAHMALWPKRLCLHSGRARGMLEEMLPLVLMASQTFLKTLCSFLLSPSQCGKLEPDHCLSSPLPPLHPRLLSGSRKVAASDL